MNKIKFLITLILIFAFPAASFSQGSDPKELFSQGTQRYIAKDYKEAKKLLSQALEIEPNNTKVLTNLALAEFQLGQKALAAGLLRKALHTEPDLSAAQTALAFVLTQIQVKDVPRQLELYESIRSQFLEHVPLSAYLVLLALSFFSAGWVGISYLGRRKRALQEEKALPTFPYIAAILSLSFMVFLGLVALKLYDSTLLRATIIEEKISVQTMPGENQVAILDLYGGMEVVIQQIQDDWAQVTYPGSLTGWIKKSALLMTR